MRPASEYKMEYKMQAASEQVLKCEGDCDRMGDKFGTLAGRSTEHRGETYL